MLELTVCPLTCHRQHVWMFIGASVFNLFTRSVREAGAVLAPAAGAGRSLASAPEAFPPHFPAGYLQPLRGI